MKNIYKLGVTLGATISIVAPLATVVACGSTKQAPTGGVGAGESEKPIDSTTKVDKTGIAAPENLIPYSADSLRNEAKAINHTQSWVKGPTYHAVSTFVSFVDQLAEEFGYSTTKDSGGKTQLENDLKNKSITLLGDKDHQTVYDAQATKTADLMFLNSLQGGALTDAQKSDLALVFGDNESASSGTLESLNITSDKFDLTKYDDTLKTFSINTGTSDEKVQLIQYSVVQTSTPGTVKITFYNGDRSVQRDIIVNNATPSYPILDSEVLKNEFAPYVKSAILKFIEIYRDDPMSDQASAFITPEIINKIKYLIDANTKEENGQKTFKIDDEKLLDSFIKLNNGSTDWLAMKAFYKGFDQTMTLVDMLPYNGNKYIGLQDDVKGVKDLSSILEVTKWAHYNSFGAILLEGQEIGSNKALDQVVKDLHPSSNLFYPSMTAAEMDVKNNVTRTQDVTDFYAKYSGDSRLLILNKSAIARSLSEIQQACESIIGFDAANTSVVTWLNDAKTIQSNAETTANVSASNKLVADIKEIEQYSTDEKKRLQDEQVDKKTVFEDTWNSLKLVGNKQTSKLKTDDLLSINEVKKLLATGQTLPVLPVNNPANKGEWVYRYGIQPDAKTFTPATPTGDEKVFKVVSHENNVLKLVVQFSAAAIKDIEPTPFMTKRTNTLQFEISDINN